MDAVSPDFAYDIALELTTNPKYFNSALGGRNAGSDAEARHCGLSGPALWRRLASQMWKNRGFLRSLAVQRRQLYRRWQRIPVYSYATASTPRRALPQSWSMQAKGTMWDYQELDVTGKIVLIDIDQRADWWITYPMLEAEHQVLRQSWQQTWAALPKLQTMPSTARTSAALPISPPCPLAWQLPGASGEAGRWDRHRHPGGGQPGGGGHRDPQCDRRAEGQILRPSNPGGRPLRRPFLGLPGRQLRRGPGAVHGQRPWWTADISRKTT